MEDAIRRRLSFNVIFLKTMFKVDVFVSGKSHFERESSGAAHAMGRRQGGEAPGPGSPRTWDGPRSPLEILCYMQHNQDVIRAGIREVRQNLSLLLEQVRKGHEVIITYRGHPVATLSRYEPSEFGKTLPDRRKRIRSRSKIRIDSAQYAEEMRNRP